MTTVNIDAARLELLLTATSPAGLQADVAQTC